MAAPASSRGGATRSTSAKELLEPPRRSARQPWGHWPEYCCEAFGLALFMVAAAAFATLLEHPDSPVRQAVASDLGRRALMGLAMGLVAIGNVYSPWGRRSGGHLNPALTLTFLALGKVAPRDALFYVAFQFLGGTLGIAAACWVLGMAGDAPTVRWVVTVPGELGAAVAFAAEVLISFGLVLLVLASGGRKRLAPFTGLLVGALICLYITVESPLSGMSMNPARTLGSALGAELWSSLWIYFTAPPLGMLAAAAVHRFRGARPVVCAKLHHDKVSRCIFRCQFTG